MSVAEEKEWKEAVARGEEDWAGPEWRTTEGWEEKALCVEV
jgi:hypothetical protein